MTDIKEKLEEAAKLLADNEKVAGLLREAIESLEPEEPEFKEGDLVAVRNYQGGVFLLREYSHFNTHLKTHFVKGKFGKQVVRGFKYCKRAIILEEGQTAIVFDKERPELEEGDKGYYVMFGNGEIGQRKGSLYSMTSRYLGCDNLSITGWAVWK